MAGKYDNLYKSSIVPTVRDGKLGLELFYAAWKAGPPQVWDLYRTWLSVPSAPADTGTVTPALSITFTSVPTNTLTKSGGIAVFRFNGTKGTGTTAAGTSLIQIPAGYRGTGNSWGHAWVVGSTTPLQVYYDAGTDTIKANASIAASQSIAMTLVWPVTR